MGRQIPQNMHPIRLSILEWVGVAVSVVRMIFLIVVGVLMIPFQWSRGPKSFFRHAVFLIVRAMPSSFAPRALAAISPTTDGVYHDFMRSRRLKPDTVTLADGTRAHWLGDQSAERVLVFFHGGGYVMYAVEGHFRLLLETIKTVEGNGGKLAVLFLSYDVSVQAPYPRQLQQASALMEHLLSERGVSPSNIILAGDSAGGNLTLGILSHILHPHPKVDALNVSGQFAGVALLSPWVTFDTVKAESMQRNRYKDYLAIPVLNSWAAVFRGSATSDYYMEPLTAPLEWWQGLPVQRGLLLAGEDEVLFDDIQKFSRVFTTVEVSFCPVENEPHDHLVMEFSLDEPRSKQREIFEEWVCGIVCR